MTESGFKYFIEFMQARNAPPKPKRRARREFMLPIATPPPLPDEDYTGSVCLLHSLTELFPTYLEVLVDSEDMDILSSHRWNLVRSGSCHALRVTNTRGKFLHAVVMNAPKGMSIDHIFHCTLDNRKSKLRVVTVRENNLNRRPKSNGSSRYKGVQRSKITGKWFVHAGPRGGKVYIGGFDSEVEAAIAYNGLARHLYGSAAYLNPIDLTS